MRIAICISGQPRSVAKGYEYLKKNLLDHYDVGDTDIFIHTWNKHGEFSYEVNKYYGAMGEGYTIAHPEHPLHKDFINARYPRVDNPAFPAFNTYSMWYSVYKANMLKKLWEDQKGFKFDIVIRTRFDYALNKVIDFSQVNPNKLYVPNCRMTPAKDFCSDIFAYGSSEVMDLYSNTFNNIDHFYRLGAVMNGEHMLAANLRAYGLVGPNMEYVDMNNPFPPGKYNGNWHSIIRDDFEKYKVEGR